MKYTLGIDIGGTNIKGGVVTPRGKVIKSVSIPAEAKRGHTHFLKNIFRCIELLGTARRAGIGVGCPGPLNPTRGIILETPNIPLKNFPLRAVLVQRYHLPTVIDNDANAFVLAEATYGAGKRYRSVVGLTLGTGVGGGIVIDKVIEHGRGNAGELGYITLSMHGPRGRLGDRGALQEYLRGEPQQTLKRHCGLARYSMREIDLLARRGNRAALRFWKVVGFRLGSGITTIIHVLDPDIIILGGQMSKAFRFFRASLTTTIRERAIVSPPPIRRAALGDHAGIIGAALLTRQ